MGGSVGLGRGSLLLGLGTTGSVGWRMSLWSFPGSLEGQNLKQSQAWRQKGREGRQNSPLWDSFNLRSLAFIFLLYILISPKPFHTFSAASGDRHYLKNQYLKLFFLHVSHLHIFCRFSTSLCTLSCIPWSRGQECCMSHTHPASQTSSHRCK